MSIIETLSTSLSGVLAGDTPNFEAFAAAISKQFARLSKHRLFHANVDGRELEQLYLDSFPEGTNPIYRVRPVHDGSYDRHFIRKLGNVVAVLDGRMVTLWDAPGLAYPYNKVAEVLSARIRVAEQLSPISGLFCLGKKETSVGYERTTEIIPGVGSKVWNHFHADIPVEHRTDFPDTTKGDAAARVQVFRRGLKELRLSALNDILGLIDDRVIYRGEEFRAVTAAFRDLLVAYWELPGEYSRELFVWANCHQSCALYRNTVIGTLAIDLSEGVDIDAAVASFEAKVAPQNYRRPSAVITKGMVESALKTIQNLGLEPALSRRLAKLSDLSVLNILWVSGAARWKMHDGGISAILSDAVIAPPPQKAAEAISIEDFIANVLPKATGLEVFVENRHQKNFVSITTAEDPSAAPLFKWDNPFGWSYNGNVADSIKERVKKAGGNILADLRVSLSWYNYDDLDLHCEGPYGHIYFGLKKGILDVDMNAGGRNSRTPVENLAFIKPWDGEYRVFVNQFFVREYTDPGFTVEVENNGRIETFTYPRAVSQDRSVEVARLTVANGIITKIVPGDKRLTRTGASVDVWGVTTGQFVRATTVMLSPNYWDDRQVGNKHTFFLLDGCRNQEPTRGIYNEFLRGDLEAHRKVFEILGERTKCQPDDEQLSGVGFSSTIRESVTVKVTGPKINAQYNIQF
jgi:hypothetical protein